MEVKNFVKVERILFLETQSKKGILSEMVSASADCLENQSAFEEAIHSREELLSTGIGYKVAFPHAKTKDVKEFFITVGICKSGVEWGSFDEQSVCLIFMIGGIIDKQEEYLKLLAGLSAMIKKEERRSQLLNADSKESVINLINHFFENE